MNFCHKWTSDIVVRCSVVENPEKGGVSWGFGKTLLMIVLGEARKSRGSPIFVVFFAFL